MSKKIIDLFCGCGGLSKGFELAGFETILAIDMWDDAIKTYNYNHKNEVAICKDIRELDNDFLEKFANENQVVGIIGGPPCQGYSTVGKRDINDERNYLYLEYCRVVEKIKPQFFVIENVKGLLTLNDGLFKDDIINRFGKLGYTVTYRVLNASDYGVPQNRQRVFFIGIKNKEFQFPKAFEYKVSTKDAIGDLENCNDFYAMEPQTEYQKLMRNNQLELNNNELTIHSPQTTAIVNLVPDGGKIKDIEEKYWNVRKYNKAFQRMNSKLPSNTIDTGHRNYFHYKENRIPTVRESARIQSFSDDFYFLGSKTSQYKQVGNAVPPLLAKSIACAINEQLEDNNDN